jgi:hypothetical protein
MQLDNFDIRVLEMSGNASDILFELYHDKIGKNNAEKQLAGIRKHLNFKKRYILDEREIGEMEEIITKADGSITTKRMLYLSEEDSKDPTRIMELMGFDPIQWKLEWCKTHRNYWDVSMKLGDKESGYYPKKSTNHAFMCELRVTPIQGKLTSDNLKEVFKNVKSPDLIKYAYKSSSGNLLELPIMDLHLGKLAWGAESGDDYDLGIAEELYKSTITEHLQKIKDYNIDIERIVFPIGQDFFHFDNPYSKTTKGTLMDTDTRWQKMYHKGTDLAVWAVENLRAIAPVDSMYVASNHDKMMSFALTLHLDAYFRKDENVNVKLSPYPRQYYRWGKCLIGYSHGSDEGKRIEKLMQDESPDWSDTVFREFHLGHIHSEQAREDVGLIIRHISAITSRDTWHTEHGYRAIRKSQAFIWNKEKGKVATLDANVMV